MQSTCKNLLTGCGEIPIEKLRIMPFFRREDIAECVMSVDKAGTEGGDGAYLHCLHCCDVSAAVM